MKQYQWGPEGPLPEAYSRVTNAERFRPLHNLALDVLHQLEEGFEVQRAEGYQLDPDLSEVDLARPSVKLVPADPSAAPIVVAFTVFPGLRVKCGRWFADGFPACGCDACAETADGEGQRFQESIESVVRGRFRERITIPWLGAAHQQWELWSFATGASGGLRIGRARARELIAGGPQSFDWRPWPPR